MQSSLNLIIGADSAIGKNLKTYLQGMKTPIIGTTRRLLSSAPDLMHLDLSRSSHDLSFPDSVETAFFCAGISKLADCRSDPIGTRLVNVTRTVELIETLAAREIFVLFLSTNLVFDGTRKYYLEYDTVSPETEYGRQKVEVEKKLLNLGKELERNVAIVRLSKVLTPAFSLFQNWYSHLKNEQAIHPFQNVTLSPLPTETVAIALTQIAHLRKPGVFHLSAKDEITYSKAAQLLAHHTQFNPHLIQPCDALRENLNTEWISRHSVLSTEKIQREGIEIPTSEEVCSMYFQGEFGHPSHETSRT